LILTGLVPVGIVMIFLSGGVFALTLSNLKKKTTPLVPETLTSDDREAKSAHSSLAMDFRLDEEGWVVHEDTTRPTGNQKQGLSERETENT